MWHASHMMHVVSSSADLTLILLHVGEDYFRSKQFKTHFVVGQINPQNSFNPW
jgi:hypothetical protein